MTQKACIVGGGVIGGGWAARFLLNGWDVAVFDPDPEAERKIGEVIDNARRHAQDRSLPAEPIAQIWEMLVETSIDYELAEWDRIRA